MLIVDMLILEVDIIEYAGDYKEGCICESSSPSIELPQMFSPRAISQRIGQDTDGPYRCYTIYVSPCPNWRFHGPSHFFTWISLSRWRSAPRSAGTSWLGRSNNLRLVLVDKQISPHI